MSRFQQLLLDRMPRPERLSSALWTGCANFFTRTSRLSEIDVEFYDPSRWRRTVPMPTNRTDSITRRGFLELSSAALVSTSLLTNANAAEREPGLENAPVPDASAPAFWIALEEHFAIPETF